MVGLTCDLRGLHDPVAAVLLTPPNPGRTFFTHRPTDCLAIVYPGRALFPDGDGEHLFEVRFRRSLEGNKLRSQAATVPCGSARRWSE